MNGVGLDRTVSLKDQYTDTTVPTGSEPAIDLHHGNLTVITHNPKPPIRPVAVPVVSPEPYYAGDPLGTPLSLTIEPHSCYGKLKAYRCFNLSSSDLSVM
ncbi:hypothetical protein RF11_05855 [Thelohanellus kitauei]|uniref:Uncharacterized protein n=1 Tax=Thelohanellus kitauei TaxID=669202 RepID=A0A0C2I7G0_THEKT|nr:hypothetical protein RF11_05855 [Thelohanellus kitauei]